MRRPAAVLACWLLATAALAQPFAERIDASNFARVAVRGSHAIGGVGDWALGNGVLCATVADADHAAYLSTRGGMLVDIGHCDRADDLWNAMHPLFNMSKDRVMPVAEVHAERDANSASIVATGERDGVAMRIVYRIAQDRPTQLQIDTTLTRQRADSTRLFLFGLLALHPNRTLSPFSLSLTKPAYNTGFKHPALDVDNIRSVIAAMQPSEWQILVGSPNTPPVSYGWGIVGAEHINAGGRRTKLPLFAFNSQDVTMFGVFSAPLFYTRQKPGLLEFAQTPWLDLAVGETLHIEQRLLLGDRADVANIADQLYDGDWVEGRLDKPRASASLHIDSADGRPLTMVVPDAEGRFAARLPAGTKQVRLRVAGSGFAPFVRAIDIDRAHTDIGTVDIPPPCTLVLPRGPLKIVFKGIDGTPDPVLFDDGRQFSVGERGFDNGMAHGSVALAGIESDYRHVALAPGRYRVYATRGPLYTATASTLEAIGGAVQYLAIRLPQRAVTAEGWLGADLHVHGGYSFDSDLPPEQRLIQFAAQGADVMVASEHNVAADYRPWLAGLGLRQRLAVIGGSELTGMAHGPNAPRTMGHANVFPLAAQPEAFRGGLSPHEDRPLGDVIATYKTANPHVFFQLNHPRSTDRDADMAYFNHLSPGENGFDPQQSLTHRHNATLLIRRANGYRDIDFDGMELLNGSAFDAYESVRADWFSLLRQGYIKVGTANSDAHAAADTVALPRNFVRFDATDLATLDIDAFVAAVKAGKVVGSTGPLIDMKLEGIGLGEVLYANSGTLTVRVDAAPWIGVERLDIFVNGKRWQSVPIRAGMTHSVWMSFSEPSFVTAEVHGTAGDIYRALAPGLAPMAFTNPIFVLPKQ